MTKRNILALCGLFVACGLQAGEPTRLSGAPLAKALAELRQTRGVPATPAIPFRVPTGGISNIATQAPDLRSYFSNKGADIVQGTKANANWLWDKSGQALSGIGSNIGYGWNRWKDSRTGSVPTYLGQWATGAANLAVNPYIAQSIASRLPSASFVKDYPGTTNVAALASALGAGYGLKQLYNRYQQPVAVPLDIQISQLLAQEKLLDMQLNGEEEYSTKAQDLYLLGYQGGLYNELNNTPINQKDKIKTLQEKIEATENRLGIVRAQIKEVFAAKVDEIVAQTPGSTSQKMSALNEILTIVTDPQFLALNNNPAFIKKFGVQLPAYYNDIRFINALENKLRSFSILQSREVLPQTLELQIRQVAEAKQEAENELYRKLRNKKEEELSLEEAKYAIYAKSIINDLNFQLQKLLQQQQKTTGWFGWWKGK